MNELNIKVEQLVAEVPVVAGRAFNYFEFYWPFIQTVAGVLSFVLLVFCIYLIISLAQQNKMGRKSSDVYFAAKASKKRVLGAWQTVNKLRERGGETDLKLAVIEADKILDEMLQVAGFAGENLGERLKSVRPGQMTNLNEVWRAHKVRNRLVHEAEAKLGREEAEEILNIYKNVFLEFGLLRE